MPRELKITGQVHLPSTRVEDDYNNLRNKPQINSVELVGNKQLDEIGIIEATSAEILQLFEGV